MQDSSSGAMARKETSLPRVTRASKEITLQPANVWHALRRSFEDSTSLNAGRGLGGPFCAAGVGAGEDTGGGSEGGGIAW